MSRPVIDAQGRIRTHWQRCIGAECAAYVTHEYTEIVTNERVVRARCDAGGSWHEISRTPVKPPQAEADDATS